MKQIVYLGSTSDHGGTMITASGNFTANGIDGCVDGDLHQCPIQGHGTTPVTSTSSSQAEGRGLLRTGDKAACGATIVTGASGIESD